jgi:drug/metabolite transporter (DMT)-like permease
MLFGMIVGLALAVACAVGTSVAFLLKHRGAVLAPPVRVRHPLRSAVDLFRSRWFAVGWVVAVGAWALHVGALALAPLSIVQAVLSGGLVFLAVFAERFFGFRLGRRQWAGVIVTAAGLAVIGLTSGQNDEQPGYALAALIAIECGVIVVSGAVAAISTHRRVSPAVQGLLLGAAAGALFGVSDIAITYLADAVEDGALKLISPWTAAALVASVGAFYASARGLQLGPGVEVIALTSVAANLIAIVGGILVFRDPVGSGALEITGRMLAFWLVVVGAALIPAPVRATDAPSDASGVPGTVAPVSNP